MSASLQQDKHQLEVNGSGGKLGRQIGARRGKSVPWSQREEWLDVKNGVPHWWEAQSTLPTGDQSNLVPHATHLEYLSTLLTNPHPHLHTNPTAPQTSLNASLSCTRPHGPCRRHLLLGNIHLNRLGASTVKSGTIGPAGRLVPHSITTKHRSKNKHIWS